MDEGLCYFKSMGPVYSIPATIEPYACLVDLVGCAGHLHVVEDVDIVRMWSRQCRMNYIFLSGWPCLVLTVEFMESGDGRMCCQMSS
jgi:hypothetical protein